MPIASNPNGPTFCFDDLPLHWQMTRPEKYAFDQILKIAEPETAIEIGTYRGGSLQNVAQAAKHVYSLDIDPSCKETLGGRFPNVDFRTGDSKKTIGEVLAEIRDRRRSLGFVLVDGDHSAAGVQGDVAALLQHVPTRDVYVVMHDSFNPDVRSGIVGIDWARCPYAHFVEVDFIPGVYHKQTFDTAQAGSMWGGFAMAVLKPLKRMGPLTVHRSQQGLFDAVLADSMHALPAKKMQARTWLSPFFKSA